MVLSAARRIGVDPSRVVVIGDIGSDMGAAVSAGAQGILVPNSSTRAEEIRAAPRVAQSLFDAVSLLVPPPGGPTSAGDAR